MDLRDPQIYVDGSCAAIFARLRTEAPVHWNPEPEGAGFWAITRYDDVARVVRDPETFSAALENGGMRIFNKHDVTDGISKPHLLTMDPPQHTQLRRALLPMFAPDAIAAMRGSVRARAMRLVDDIAERGEAEFVSAIAVPLTIGLLTELIAVPESDSGKLLKWSNALIGDDDEDYQASPEFRRQCVMEMDAYALRLFNERKPHRGNDFVSLLAHAEVDGGAMDFESFSSNFGMFLIAANETTRHALAAGLLAFSLHPSQKEKLVTEPALIESAVKEVVRWVSPLQHVRRTVMKDTEIRGKTLRKGDKVVVWYNSANRDAEKWSDPERFDVTRFARSSAVPHLAFGAGPHHCIGWRLAELQLSVALQELLRRLPDIRATGPVHPLRSNFIGGIKQMRVIFTPEKLPGAARRS